MNVLFVTRYHSINGSIRSLLDLSSGLSDLGVQSCFTVPAKGSFSEFLEKRGLPYRILPLPWWVNERIFTAGKKVQRIKEISRSENKMRGIIQEWKIDLVYTNTSVTPVGRLAAALEGLPHIWHIREFGDLHFGLKPVFPLWMYRRIIRSSSAILCHAQVIMDQDALLVPGQL